MEFLNIGGGELLVIVLVALILFGPEDILKMMRTVGRYARQARDMWSQFSSGIQQEFESEEIQEALEETKATVSEAQEAIAALKTTVGDIKTTVEGDVSQAQRSMKAQAAESAAALAKQAKIADPTSDLSAAVAKSPPPAPMPAVEGQSPEEGAAMVEEAETAKTLARPAPTSDDVTATEATEDTDEETDAGALPGETLDTVPETGPADGESGRPLAAGTEVDEPVANAEATDAGELPVESLDTMAETTLVAEESDRPLAAGSEVDEPVANAEATDAGELPVESLDTMAETTLVAEESDLPLAAGSEVDEPVADAEATDAGELPVEPLDTIVETALVAEESDRPLVEGTEVDEPVAAPEDKAPEPASDDEEH